MVKRPTRAKMFPSKSAPIRAGLRLLRSLRSVELWHIEESRKPGQKLPAIHYMVKEGDNEHTFSRPHEAWAYFQQRTGAPSKDTRPVPPPIEEAFLGSSRKSRSRPRRGVKA